MTADPLSTLHPHYGLQKRGGDELEYCQQHIVLFREHLNTARFENLERPPGKNMCQLNSVLMGWTDWIMEERLLNGEFEYDWRRNDDSGINRILAA